MQGFEILLMFWGISSLVALPLLVLLGVPLMAWNLRAFIHLKERELNLRRLQTAAVIRQSRTGLLPQYVDVADPQALLAWMQAEAEMAVAEH